MEDTGEDEIDAGGELEVLDPTGHFEVRWGRKKAEVELAEKTFYDLLAKGYTAFKKTWTGRKGEPPVTFEAKDGVYIFDKAAEVAKAETTSEPVSVQPANSEAVTASEPTPVQPEAVKAKTEVESESESSSELTREFDKKAKTTLAPRFQGG